ncbi:MAG: hypothetical protein EOP21_05340 [Hyphomicrobiales bacterium]|nr:MAG: hypothetical protein EOP21_05340 [Hyphomicrobiales bacterium]
MASKQERRQHLAVNEVRAVEQGDHKIDLRPLHQRIEAVGGDHVQTDFLQRAPQFVMIDRVIAVLCIGRAVLAGVLRKEHHFQAAFGGFGNSQRLLHDPSSQEWEKDRIAEAIRSRSSAGQADWEKLVHHFTRSVAPAVRGSPGVPVSKPNVLALRFT